MRTSGILMPIASLPSPHAIGDFGKEAYCFIDRIKEAGFRLWQVLPLNPLGYGNSPYQPLSSKAISELYISLDFLYEEGLLKERVPHINTGNVQYEKAKEIKVKYLKEAYSSFVKNESYHHFIAQEWVQEYAIFQAFKKINHGEAWTRWKEEYKNYPHTRDSALYTRHKEEIEYECFVQYLAFSQFHDLKEYAHRQGILIMGDLPFYVGLDSDDVWFHQEAFLLDENGEAKWIAGVPPDYFSPTGQRWGNPIYDWDYLKENEYAFWMERLCFNQNLYDLIRIDHFRGFDTFWKIDAREETAEHGEWIENCGDHFFSCLFKKHPHLKIVAEDLGELRPEVHILKNKYHLKGMRVIEFDFDGKSIVNEIAYTGTHDNESLKAWYHSRNHKERKHIAQKMKKRYPKLPLFDAILQYTLDTRSEYAILSIVDIMQGDAKKRINQPGTIGSPNWEYRLKDEKTFLRRMKKMYRMNQKAKRL